MLAARQQDPEQLKEAYEGIDDLEVVKKIRRPPGGP
ncbi:hypothetical protein ES705_26664 [subsurface metagenome]